MTVVGNFFEKICSKMPTKLLCYLCGKEIVLKDEADDDHVPMKQLYSKEIRMRHAPNLLTLRTHKACNKSFQHDEDYFVSSFAGFVTDTYSGSHVWSQVERGLRRPEGAGLRELILKEFSEVSPGGIHPPPGKIFKSYDTPRIHRVVWKITRGIFFKEFGRWLPENTPRTVQITPPGEPPPKEFGILNGTTSKGAYPGVFDYKYKEVTEPSEFRCYTIGYLFWDKLICLCHFHDPECPCAKCKEKA